jgi:dethiobiotin synthetase
VGKTVVSGALIRALKADGLDACGMKPVESGCEKKGGELLPTDGMFLREVSEAREAIGDITPCRLEHPLAPMVAAELEGRELDPLGIERAVRRMSERHDVLVVEGVGGLLAPITRHYSVLDMARTAGFPLIVVASPALGTINHTMLTVNHALKEGLDVAGVIVNFSSPPLKTPAERTNPDVIRELSPVAVVGVMPFIPDINNDALEAAARENLDMEVLRKFL